MPSHGHLDRSPSLRLFLDDGIFFCFGCGSRGDVVEWVCQLEALTWSEAISVLDSGRLLANAWSGTDATASWPGGQPEGSGPGKRYATAGRFETPDLSRTPPARVYAALGLAWELCSRAHLHALGVAYLARRGIEVALLEALNARAEVGHSPARRRGLVSLMRAKGFDADELVDAGLAQRRVGDHEVFDFYYERVLVPVRDGEGRICGLIGRNIGDERRPKYKNPPRTSAYDKAVNLYRPLRAPAHPDGDVVVVEGTLDAMAIAVAAIRSGLSDRLCPLTQSGRELSPRQVQQVLALHPGTPIVSFDGDAAGEQSNQRLASAFATAGRQPIVTALPRGHDPASLLAERGDEALATWSTVWTRGDLSTPMAASPACRREARADSAEAGLAVITTGGPEL